MKRSLVKPYGYDMKKHNPQDETLAGFGQELVTEIAVPILSRGFGDLVSRFRQNHAMAKIVAEKGIDAILSPGNEELASLQKGNKELVTSFEKEAEAAMRQAVNERFPGHAIVGEEYGFQKGSDMRWVFDPVDGTSAMIRTALAEAFSVRLPEPRPAFGITVALVDGDEAAVGVIAELKPERGNLRLVHIWVAENGKTTMDGKSVHLSKAPQALSSAIVACTVPEVMFNTAEKWSGWQVLSEATKACVTDQNCVGFMRLLQGGIDIVYESDLAYHDVAALVPILQGAGVIVTDNKGQKLYFSESAITKEFTILAAQSSLHGLAVNCIRQGVPAERNSFAGRSAMHCGYANKFPAS